MAKAKTTGARKMQVAAKEIRHARLELPGDDYERLKRLSKREDDQQMRVFKAELRQALTDPSQLPAGELDDAVEYDDGSDEKFLRRLWHDLYGNEPITSP